MTTTRKSRAEPNGTRPLYVRIPAAQYRQLRLMSVDREQPVAELVREGLAAYLKKTEAK